ncbi:hypothetical protein, partial [Burkholderia stagnalis]|uniref:hypothetical protein n=1 Tax=Burkholderia stagnalis TaxID=1503054 RepID=UPI001C898E9A
CFTRNDSTLESESQPRLTHGIPDTSLCSDTCLRTCNGSTGSNRSATVLLPATTSALSIADPHVRIGEWVSAIVEVRSPAAFYQSVRCGLPLVADDNSIYGA